MERIIPISKCNPFIRHAQYHPPVLEGVHLRIPYDNRLFGCKHAGGFFVAGGTRYPIADYTIIFCPVGIAYDFENVLRSCIVFDFDMTRGSDDRNQAIAPGAEEKINPELFFDLTRLKDMDIPFVLSMEKNIWEKMHEVMCKFNQSHIYSDVESSILLKQLLLDLLKMKTQVQKQSRLAVDLQNYINLNATRSIDNQQIGTHFGYNPIYLNRVFKEETGISLHQAIVKTKIEIAKYYLENSDLSVERIADYLGYSSRTTFHNVFKKITGLSPANYRNRHPFSTG